MVSISVEISHELLEELVTLSKENHRDIEQEISYRLEQAVRYKTHLSREDIGLIEALAKHIGSEESEEDFRLLECVNREDSITH